MNKNAKEIHLKGVINWIVEWSGILVVTFGIVTLMHPTSANVGATCAAGGNQCAALTGGYCDLDAANGPKCACAAINDGAACTPKDCSTDATVCTTADTNSVCVNTKCTCKATFELTGADDSNLCVAKSNAVGHDASVILLFACSISTVLRQF
ncbi:uncharacterized protein LOC128229894 isoform X2 [Mya arenaria]|uniref:uncharacterized protein LOC128229894 isoform X2 n=1 Tax=Mya arenaria TaxID=6604 RepID=UPI0022E4015C|nr:uncharacterized protein LOC128229894 isoform X2 [Mya arenaria]